MRIAVTCGPTSQNFLPPVERLLREGGHEVRRFTGDHHEITANVVAWQADAVFHEWLDSIAFHLSRVLPPRIKMVVRMHRFEAETEWPSKMDWMRARLLVTSQHVLDRAEARCPRGLAKWANPVIVPSIVDFDAFSMWAVEGANELRFAVVGLWSARKQPILAIEAARAIAKDWRVRLDFVGRPDPSEPWWPELLKAQPTDGFMAVLGPWSDDIPGVWATHDACLSASADEGCPYNVIEAMACGRPAFVFNYPGAEEQFPAEFLWSTLGELKDAVDEQIESSCGWTPAQIRAWAEERFSIEAVREMVLKLFEETR